MAEFLVTIAGIGVLLAMVIGSPSVWAFVPGLLLIGLGLGLMFLPRTRAPADAPRPGHEIPPEPLGTS